MLYDLYHGRSWFAAIRSHSMEIVDCTIELLNLVRLLSSLGSRCYGVTALMNDDLNLIDTFWTEFRTFEYTHERAKEGARFECLQ